MHLLSPTALWLLPLVAILLWLARRRLTRPRLVVSNLYMWRAALEYDPLDSTRVRLRRDWLVVLRVAFMVVVIAALARPVISWRTRHLAFVFDESASMSARDGSETRLDRARQRARSVIDGLPRNARVRVIAAKTVPVDLGEFTAGGPALSRAIDALAAGGGAASIDEAIRLARLRDGDAELAVFTDLERPQGGDAASSQWHQVGQPAPNVAITVLEARRLPAAPRGGQVLVELFNYGSEAREVNLDVAENGDDIIHEIVRVAARSPAAVVREFREIGGVLTARIAAPADALAIDDQRTAIVPPLRRIRVARATPLSFFLEKALAVNPALSADAASADDRVHIREDVVVCDGCRSLPPGDAGVLLIAPPATVEYDAAPFVVSAPSHPVARSLDLSGVTGVGLPPAMSLANAEVIVRAGGVPVVVCGDQSGRRVVTLNLDISTSSVPLSAAFPVLIANAVAWLAAADENPRQIVAGEPLRWRLRDQRISSLSLGGPDGRSRSIRPTGRQLTFTETELPGVYTIRGDGLEERVAVNPATESESDLRLPSAATAVRSQETAQRAQQGSLIAVPLLVAALLLFAAEWALSPAARDLGSLVRRSAVALLLVLSAAELRMPLGRGSATVVFALDRSDSVSLRSQRQATSRMNLMLHTMHAGDQAGLVVFGKNAMLERRPAALAAAPEIASVVATSGTDIEGAIRLARAALPSGGGRRIVLMSDGRQTSGDAFREAARAAAGGVRIDVVPLADNGDQGRAPRVRRVIAPDVVRTNEPFPVTVEVRGPPGTHARLMLHSDAQPSADRDVEIQADGVATAAFVERRVRPGIYTYRAAITDAAGDPIDREAGASVVVSDQPSILYVSSQSGPHLSGNLAAAGFRVSSIPPEAIPAAAGPLAAFDAVVLDDVSAEMLSTVQTSALAQYVERTGGGLLLLGSRRSLDAVGYPDGPLGPLLPIDLRPRTGRRASPIAFVLLFDKSGSMADEVDGVQKIELARQAGIRVIGAMPATDWLGIVAFDAKPVVVAPLANTLDPRSVAERLRAIRPGGSTEIAPAMDLAIDWLRRAPVDERRLFLISDGRTSRVDADRLRAAVPGRGIQLSVAAIGADADQALLRALADGTGGRAYFPDDIRRLPEIVARDATRSSGGAEIDENFAIRAPLPHPILTGLRRTSLPMLGGYVASAAKPGADTVLVSHLQDPVLAGWRFGLGRVAVFTSDLGSHWGAPMRRWADFGTFWTQTVRWLSRPSPSSPLYAEIDDAENGFRILVAAERQDGGFAALRNAHVVVRTPSGHTQDVVLRPTAPGRYEAALAAGEPGAYEMIVSSQDASTGSELGLVRAFYWTGERERAAEGTDLGMLTRLAEMTGGRVLSGDASPFNEPRPPDTVELSSLLAIIALVLFLTEVAAHRGFALAHTLRRLQRLMNRSPAAPARAV